eukprot:GHVQ01026329.1.p1 GENE.GHVQ01026329.1~~GHVQ01026329.1.p1  ORF type:complete len:392 (+),score=78.06 GHVQ01026329.1:188-1363(+)
MVDIRQSPPREGTRGGLELFEWNHVKGESMRDRECFLGSSLKIGIAGRGGRFYKHDWWTKKREKGGDAKEAAKEDEEMKILKAYEDELMLEALGVKPKNLLLRKEKLSKEEMQKLLESRNNTSVNNVPPEPPPDISSSSQQKDNRRLRNYSRSSSPPHRTRHNRTEHSQSSSSSLNHKSRRLKDRKDKKHKKEKKLKHKRNKHSRANRSRSTSRSLESSRDRRRRRGSISRSSSSSSTRRKSYAAVSHSVSSAYRPRPCLTASISARYDRGASRRLRSRSTDRDGPRVSRGVLEQARGARQPRAPVKRRSPSTGSNVVMPQQRPQAARRSEEEDGRERVERRSIKREWSIERRRRDSVYEDRGRKCRETREKEGYDKDERTRWGRRRGGEN